MTLAVLMLDSWRCQGEAFQELGKFLPRNIAFPRSAPQPFMPDYLYFMMHCLQSFEVARNAEVRKVTP